MITLDGQSCGRISKRIGLAKWSIIPGVTHPGAFERNESPYAVRFPNLLNNPNALFVSHFQPLGVYFLENIDTKSLSRFLKD